MTINHIRPSYYKSCGEIGRRVLGHWMSDALLDRECGYAIASMGNDFDLGMALKYLWRAGVKTADATEDLTKAHYYLKEHLLMDDNACSGQVDVAMRKVEFELESMQKSNQHIEEIRCNLYRP